MSQQRGRGGLDQDTERLLNSAVRDSEANLDKTLKTPVPSKQARRIKKPQLQAGVTLVREWRGKTYKVKVTEDAKGQKRFCFAGREYRSLTIIAKEITGAHWSGPRFFGLNRVRSTG
jgi:tRNA A37 methylthiotransferase MiaB